MTWRSPSTLCRKSALTLTRCLEYLGLIHDSVQPRCSCGSVAAVPHVVFSALQVGQFSCVLRQLNLHGMFDQGHFSLSPLMDASLSRWVGRERKVLGLRSTQGHWILKVFLLPITIPEPRVIYLDCLSHCAELLQGSLIRIQSDNTTAVVLHMLQRAAILVLARSAIYIPVIIKLASVIRCSIKESSLCTRTRFIKSGRDGGCWT